MNENYKLFRLKLAVQMKNFIEFLRVAANYYTNIRFAKIDLSLLLLYFVESPFSISKEYLVKKGEKEIYAYGETPLTSLDHIASECQINSEDTVFELGCGRGRTCFWLNTFIKCKVVGIDFVPQFIERANTIKNRFGVKNVEFRHENMLHTNLNGATVIYLYGTCLEDSDIQQLVAKFQTLPPGTKIITISYPLSEYTSEPIFEVMKHFTARFTWGDADVYLQIRK